MSTHSFIGRKNLDGSVTGVYCHWDGYVKHNGQILFDHYYDINKINELINLGSLSSLGPEIGTKTDFNNPVDGQCVAYHRDRGEDLEITNCRSDRLPSDWFYAYTYIYDMTDSQWYVYYHDNTRVPLHSLL